ncbi:ISSag3, transposase [Streptococcus sobrinus]|nr:ISSag3, transposase [Streptococcus sobrinus]
MPMLTPHTNVGQMRTSTAYLESFVPKGKSLKTLTAEDLAKVTLAINQRPRRLLNYQTAKTLFGLAQTA